MKVSQHHADTQKVSDLGALQIQIQLWMFSLTSLQPHRQGEVSQSLVHTLSDLS
jgi:hypothetical protein